MLLTYIGRPPPSMPHVAAEHLTQGAVAETRSGQLSGFARWELALKGALFVFFAGTHPCPEV